jgi:hypothetical protein
MRLTIDKSGSVVQFFTPTPSYNKPAQSIPPSGSVTVVIADEGVGWIRFRATGAVLVYMNGDVTYSMPFDANVMSDIMLNISVESVTFVNTDAVNAITLYRWGM